MEIETTVFDRLGGIGGSRRPCFKNQVCSFWLAGKCNKNPCRFLHPSHSSNRFNNSLKNPSLSDSKNVRIKSSTGGANVEFNGGLVKQKRVLSTDYPGPVVGSKNATVPTSTGTLKSDVSDDHVNQKRVLISERHASVVESKKVTVPSCMGAANSEGKDDAVNQKKVLTLGKPDSASENPKKSGAKLCQYWVMGNCVHGDKCKDLHSWFSGSGFSLLANLEMQNKAVIGIALPFGFDKLFSGSKDGSACVWDCNSGQCVRAVQLESEIGCMISESPWVFVGLRNAVKAWNIETQSEIVLTGPNGLVNAMDVGDDMEWRMVPYWHGNPVPKPVALKCWC